MGKYLVVLLAATLLSLSGCCHFGCKGQEAAAAPAAGPLTITNSSDVDASLGKRVTFVGEAANAKLSAMVHTKAMMLYCIEMPDWPDEVHGKQVRVTGVLARTDQFKAKVAKDGAISQGTAGGDELLRDVTWELVE